MVPVEPVDETAPRIVLPRVATHAATARTAEEFGRRLAVTHDTGASWFGCPPPDWSGEGFIGPILLPYNRSHHDIGWGEFFARYRVEPFAEQALSLGSLSRDGAALIRRLCDRLAGNDPDVCGPPEPPSRLHGDLWSGNVLWDEQGAVLIDPAAHGGHRESDLAMLALFGIEHLDRVVSAYHETHALAPGWRDRIEVHQLFPVLVHAVLFGAGYGRQAVAIARRYA